MTATWKLYRWVWRLEWPLFLGLPPAGNLNRCRTYLPARTMWGALVAELSRTAPNQAQFPDYPKMGHELALSCRLTYLYPAEEANGRIHPWLPRFEDNRGLLWKRRGAEDLPDHRFRRRLLDSRMNTAVSPHSEAAEDGTLREQECINPWWRPSSPGEEPSPVFLVGYLFLKEGHFRQRLKEIQTLLVGGDTRYGLGRIQQEDFRPAQEVFECRVELGGDEPAIQGKRLLAHVAQEVLPEARGALELTAGWKRRGSGEGRQTSPVRGSLAWVPGSVAGKEHGWRIDSGKETCGYWVPLPEQD